MAKKRVFPPEFGEYFAKIGKRGGKRRLTTMTPEQRSEVARIAAAASAKVRSEKAAIRKAKEGR